MPQLLSLLEALVRTHTASDRALSWGAILGGAVAAAALSLILLALGFGLGLSSVSPWSYEGASVKAIGLGGAAWLLVMSALASGLGGFLAGRLRAKWLEVDADEAFFRDTAHGFLACGVNASRRTLAPVSQLACLRSRIPNEINRRAVLAGLHITPRRTLARKVKRLTQRVNRAFAPGVTMMPRSGGIMCSIDYAADSVQLTPIKVDATLDDKRELLTLQLQPGPLTKADVGKLMMFLSERYAKMFGEVWHSGESAT